MPRVDAIRGILKRYARAAGEAISETVWLTRCIICDAPGAVLCDRCRLRLPFIDRWQACPRCGAPLSRLECTECNTFTLGSLGRTSLPFDGCASIVDHSGDARRIVTGFKDCGERRLGPIIARMMADNLAPAWRTEASAIVYIPDTAKARRLRGFDHSEELARELARLTAVPCLSAFERPANKDQRALTRLGRFANMAGSITVKPEIEATQIAHVILIDDVLTTGATLFAASDALRAAGAATIDCCTFSRVW